MSPSETNDLEVRSLGTCSGCGQEQFLRTRAFIDASSGLSIDVRQFTDCGCGLHPYRSPDPAPEA